jgi:hypothetical protein
MKVCILSANLGNFDKPIEPVEQELPEGIESVTYHCFTDSDFPPITGLTPRFQYRLPKMFGWQMFPGYDIYIWLDASVSLQRPDSLKYYIDQLGEADMAFFKHPTRRNIRQEVDHIEEHLKLDKPYITARYKNGLHKEQLADIQLDKDFKDDKLYASTGFIYRDSERVRDALRLWFLHQARYWSCDQIALPYAIKDLEVNMMDEPIFKSGHLSLVSKHN